MNPFERIEELFDLFANAADPLSPELDGADTELSSLLQTHCGLRLPMYYGK